jgi:hypothetical protein
MFIYIHKYMYKMYYVKVLGNPCNDNFGPFLLNLSWEVTFDKIAELALNNNHLLTHSFIEFLYLPIQKSDFIVTGCQVPIKSDNFL